MSDQFILAFDAGTTSCRAILFDQSGQVRGIEQQEFEQIYPEPGHVEHDPVAIWDTQLQVVQQLLENKSLSSTDIAAIGITNQRETVVLWEAESGAPIANAIVWQSRITAPRCDQLKADGYSEMVREKTGLVIDAYFSASKIEYLLDQKDPDRTRAKAGEILFGTVDCYLLWKLTGGDVHATDVSNASRTMLYNLDERDWDDELLDLFKIPRAMMPKIVPSSGVMGQTFESLFGGKIPIASLIGDQQAATFGQCCFEPGAAKNTYGTGCFMLLNTGSKRVASLKGLLTTVAWQIGDEVTYCLEGSVFIAGAIVQWLRDGLEMIESSDEIEKLAKEVPDSGGVVIVPAFVGLGAPYWNQDARGLIIGLTRGTKREHLARAALDSMAYQSYDLLHAMNEASGLPLTELKVDGGASVNDLMMQFQADLLDVTVRRPKVAETTALGAAYLAGLAVGFWESQDQLAALWELDAEFQPQMGAAERERLTTQWHRAVERSLDWNQSS
ncbi:MAG: glycerol kinase GlpK [Planctomycetaceae bacterium]|nr:glycerol kinase GlpK [Planctomycetaceae bacterium]